MAQHWRSSEGRDRLRSWPAVARDWSAHYRYPGLAAENGRRVGFDRDAWIQHQRSARSADIRAACEAQGLYPGTHDRSRGGKLVARMESVVREADGYTRDSSCRATGAP